MTEEMKKYHRDWYHKQSPERKAQKYLLQNERRVAITKWFREYKESVGCSSCPEKDWRCLDLHHLGDKEINVSDAVSQRAWSLNRIKKEIEKCIILCSNCHRKETMPIDFKG